jgi:hypothetical protein
MAKYLISFPSAAMVVPGGEWEAVGRDSHAVIEGVARGEKLASGLAWMGAEPEDNRKVPPDGAGASRLLIAGVGLQRSQSRFARLDSRVGAASGRKRSLR